MWLGYPGANEEEEPDVDSEPTAQSAKAVLRSESITRMELLVLLEKV